MIGGRCKGQASKEGRAFQKWGLQEPGRDGVQLVAIQHANPEELQVFPVVGREGGQAVVCNIEVIQGLHGCDQAHEHQQK